MPHFTPHIIPHPFLSAFTLDFTISLHLPCLPFLSFWSLSLFSEAMPYAARLLLHPLRVNWHVQLSPSPFAVSRLPSLAACWMKDHDHRFPYKLCQFSRRRSVSSVPKSSTESDGIVPADDAEDGVSLGTLKLPSNTDLQRFETLLFQVHSHAHWLSVYTFSRHPWSTS